jgi:hypothetical protein
MHKLEFELPLGIKVRDVVTEVEGIITSRCERINGARQYYIQPPHRPDGKTGEGYTDAANLEVIDNDGKTIKDFLKNLLPSKSEVAEFKFETGDFVKNRITNKTGIVTVRRQDHNLCIGYWIENGDTNKDGRTIERFGYEQELELIDKGLNKADEAPVERRQTGSADIQSSGKVY